MGRLTTIGKKPPIKKGNRFLRWGLRLVQDLFPILLITFLLLILVETIFEDSVNRYINLDHMLIVVIVVGITAMLTAPSKPESVKAKRLTTKSIFIIICAGIGGAVIVWYKTQEISWLSYVISAVSGVMIILLSILVWGSGKEGANEEENS